MKRTTWPSSFHFVRLFTGKEETAELGNAVSFLFTFPQTQATSCFGFCLLVFTENSNLEAGAQHPALSETETGYGRKELCPSSLHPPGAKIPGPRKSKLPNRGEGKRTLDHWENKCLCQRKENRGSSEGPGSVTSASSKHTGPWKCLV